MRESSIRILGSVIKVDLVYEGPDGLLIPFFDTVAESPLMQSERLRDIMREGTASQTEPFLRRSSYDCYFAGLRAEGGYLYMGPMPHERLSAVRRRQMYRAYGIESDGLRVLPVFTLPEIRDMILLTNAVLGNANLENEDLLQLNRIVSRSETREKQDQTRFLLKEEEENDDFSYRHSYHEEQLLMQAIREGRTQEAIRLAESMDRDSGRLAQQTAAHHRNLAIVGITLCSRAAIEGGVPPETAYRLSGYYIQKCDNAQDPAHMLLYRNRAIEELSGRVAERLDRARGSNYLERARDYVRKHYREKIYLEDIAGTLGISPSYLSRLFRKESGQRLQDFINEERVYRASNLLMYSDFSLPEIADYVGFPNQSYFGKIFRQFKNMTPKNFRDRYRAAEAPGEKFSKTS